METWNGFALFGLELAFALGIGGITSRLLLPALHPVLEDLCRGAARARFWRVFTQLMLLLCPLLVVMLGSPEVVSGDAARLLRDLLIRALSGAFLALLATGYVIWRTGMAREATA